MITNATMKRIELAERYWPARTIDDLPNRACAVQALKEYDAWLRTQLAKEYKECIDELETLRNRMRERRP